MKLFKLLKTTFNKKGETLSVFFRPRIHFTNEYLIKKKRGPNPVFSRLKAGREDSNNRRKKRPTYPLFPIPTDIKSLIKFQTLAMVTNHEGRRGITPRPIAFKRLIKEANRWKTTG